jgi:subtilisin family serine protease
VTAPGCAYARATESPFCGTSAAAAVVSGVAALALTVRPDLPAADLAALLASTATAGAGSPLVDAGALLHAVAPGLFAAKTVQPAPAKKHSKTRKAKRHSAPKRRS